MADINVANLFDLSKDQINAMKKKDLVSHIESLKGKVTVNATIKKIMRWNITVINLSQQPRDRKWKN